jgi:hypothetical protein
MRARLILILLSVEKNIPSKKDLGCLIGNLLAFCFPDQFEGRKVSKITLKGGLVSL